MSLSDPNALAPQPKITSSHFNRLAVVYVRQSHPQQLSQHPESTLLQTNLRHKALLWGWLPQRIRVLDGDQGCSATTLAGRDDFNWLLDQISLGNIGLVLGFQFNRFSRDDEASSRLISLCKKHNTLLADSDGLYDASQFNDRLVLTIKGFAAAIELYQTQQRMQIARLSCAQRGKWMGCPPPGYVLGLDDKLVFDSDPDVQAAIASFFKQLPLSGSLSALLRHLHQNNIKMPSRSHHSPDYGQLVWRRPVRETLRQFFLNPAYAGIYTWGRRPVDRTRAIDGQRGSGRVQRLPHQSMVYLPDNHPAYISSEQFQANCHLIATQRRHGFSPGPLKATVALLAGLVKCGHCGSSMETRYSQNLRYVCQRHALNYGGPSCQSFPGSQLEQFATDEIIRIICEPSIDHMINSLNEYEKIQLTVEAQWQSKLAQSRAMAERLGKHFQLFDPGHRLVTREMEEMWEKALSQTKELEQEYELFREKRPRQLTEAEQASIRTLSETMPQVWKSEKTPLESKRSVVRLMLEKVVVWGTKSSANLKVRMHWTSGIVTEQEIVGKTVGWRQVNYKDEVMSIIMNKDSNNKTDYEIMDELNEKGYKPPCAEKFTVTGVRQLRSREEKKVREQEKKAREEEKKDETE